VAAADVEVAQRLARAAGITGPVTDAGGDLSVVGEHLRLDLSRAQGRWWISAADLSASWQTSSTPDLPAEPVPSQSADATEVARRLAEASGIGGNEARYETDEPFAVVTPLVDGRPVLGLAVRVLAAADGSVISASGWSGRLERIADYPLLATGAAIDRLNLEGPAALEGGSFVAVSAEQAASDGSTETSAPAVTAVEPAPGSGASAGDDGSTGAPPRPDGCFDVPATTMLLPDGTNAGGGEILCPAPAPPSCLSEPSPGFPGVPPAKSDPGGAIEPAPDGPSGSGTAGFPPAGPLPACGGPAGGQPPPPVRPVDITLTGAERVLVGVLGQDGELLALPGYRFSAGDQGPSVSPFDVRGPSVVAVEDEFLAPGPQALPARPEPEPEMVPGDEVSAGPAAGIDAVPAPANS
jgi:hypothetical protein